MEAVKNCDYTCKNNAQYISYQEDVDFMFAVFYDIAKFKHEKTTINASNTSCAIYKLQ